MIIACMGGLFLGFLGGTIISLAVGYSIASAIEEHEEKVDGGVEAGEGASKLIAFFFVLKLALKLPRWFGISNYQDDSSKHTETAVEDTTTDIESDDKAPEDSKLDSRWYLASSLFWNALRESTEAGVFVGLIVLLAEDEMDLGASIGVGIAGAAGAAIIMGLGAKYVSQLGFGVLSTVLASLLAVGLITGSVRAFEEVYDIEHDGVNTGIIYKYSDSETGDVLEAFGFAGFGKELTVIVLVTWLSSAVFIAAAQYWKHYLGHRLLPRVVLPSLPIFSRSILDSHEKVPAEPAH
jgi:high-affinity Fe2+/Pb2+ permease